MKTLCTFVLNKQHNMGGIGLVEDLEKQKNLKRCKRTLQKRGKMRTLGYSNFVLNSSHFLFTDF